MRWRIAQRMILLIDARITWLVDVMPTFAEPDAWKVHTLRNVVGAVTEDSLAVERLYWVSNFYVPFVNQTEDQYRLESLSGSIGSLISAQQSKFRPG